MPEDLSLAFEAEEPLESTLIVAFPEPGMAGISANRYLIEQLKLEEIGHIQAEGLPAITPYENGRPYHHTRLFSTDGFGYSLLTSELPIPIQLSEPFGRKLAAWIDERAVEEVALLTAIPFLEPAEELFYVASEDYRKRRLAETAMAPLGGGFLTGVNASLIARAIDTSLRVGVLATAVDPRLPLDGEAALRLVTGIEDTHEFGVDTGELQQFADESRQYYRQLTAQIEAQQQADSRHYVNEDYGFM